MCDLRIAAQRRRVRRVLPALGRAADRRRHGAPAAHRRHGPCARPDPHRPRRSAPTRRWRWAWSTGGGRRPGAGRGAGAGAAIAAFPQRCMLADRRLGLRPMGAAAGRCAAARRRWRLPGGAGRSAERGRALCSGCGAAWPFRRCVKRAASPRRCASARSAPPAPPAPGARPGRALPPQPWPRPSSICSTPARCTRPRITCSAPGRASLPRASRRWRCRGWTSWSSRPARCTCAPHSKPRCRKISSTPPP